MEAQENPKPSVEAVAAATAMLDACLERIREWDEGPRYTDVPTVAITMRRAKPPGGDSVRLFGRTGPRGRLANAMPVDGAWRVVAYFPAIAVAKELADMLGTRIDVQNQR